MSGMFPSEALGPDAFPAYNPKLLQESGFSIVSNTLEAYFFDDKSAETCMKHCTECKLDGDKMNWVAPSIIRCEQTNSILDPVKLILIGEAPGANEQQQKMGFVGDSGRILFGMMMQLWGGNLPTILLGNAILCRPRENKAPGVPVWKRCVSGFWPKILMDEDLVADGALIVTCGNTPLKALYHISAGAPTAPKLTSVHKEVRMLDFEYDGKKRTFPTLACYHPAYALHSPDKDELLKSGYETLYSVYMRIQNRKPDEELSFERSPFEVDLDRADNATVIDKALTPNQIQQLIWDLNVIYEGMDEKVVSFDVENKNLQMQDPTNYIIVAGLGAHDGSTWQFVDNGMPSLPLVLKALKEHNFILVGHNIWHDFMCAWKNRIITCADDLPLHRDTRVLQKLIDENRRDNDLKELSMAYLGVANWSLSLNQFTDAKGKKDFTKIPIKTLLKYHRGDLIYNCRLYYEMAKAIATEEVSGSWLVNYVDVKHTTNTILLQASIEGIKIDLSALQELMTQYETDLKDLRDWFKQPFFQRIVATSRQMPKNFRYSILKSLANFPLVDTYDEKKDLFNPASSEHILMYLASSLSDVAKQKLIRMLGRDAKTRGSGRISIKAANLEVINKMINGDLLFKQQFSAVCTGLQKLIEFRRLNKIYGTYLDGMLDNMYTDQCVRSHWNVDGAGTGRLSATNPNLQNIPRDATATNLKSMFVPKYDGWMFLQFDLSQAELRGMGTIANEPNMKRAYDNGIDIHTYTASLIYNVQPNDVNKKQRSSAKTTNFSEQAA